MHVTGRKAARCAALVTCAALMVVAQLAAARPAAAAGVVAAPTSLNEVIDNLRNWIVGLLVALATLFLTIGGLRYLLAGGDPGEVQKAKNTLKSAALGYALAALAPLLMTILKGVVGA
jgi:Type IV secretion system pilin